MAIFEIDISQRKIQYNGLSSDERPSDASEGSTYHAVDTGEQEIYHDGMWMTDLRLSRALESVL